MAEPTVLGYIKEQPERLKYVGLTDTLVTC